MMSAELSTDLRWDRGIRKYSCKPIMITLMISAIKTSYFVRMVMRMEKAKHKIDTFMCYFCRTNLNPTLIRKKLVGSSLLPISIKLIRTFWKTHMQSFKWKYSILTILLCKMKRTMTSQYGWKQQHRLSICITVPM